MCCCGERRLHGSFEGYPGMPGLEDHGQHAPPEIHSAERFGNSNLPTLCLRLIEDVPLGKCRAVEVMQIRGLIGKRTRSRGHRLPTRSKKRSGTQFAVFMSCGAAAVVARILA